MLVAADGNAEVRVAARDVNWLTATSWQGGGLVVDRLREVSPGVYRTTEPMPLDGEWKTMIRLHAGDALTALPVYLPADPAIPVEGIPAAPRIERAFGDEVAAAPARAQGRRRRAGCGASPTAPCWRSRSASSRCSPGACTACR